MVTEGVFTPAHVLAEAIRRREVSSLEIVEAYLAQIARHNPDLNAVVTLDEDSARMRARRADAALARGEEWGPLHGWSSSRPQSTARGCLSDYRSSASAGATSGFLVSPSPWRN